MSKPNQKESDDAEQALLSRVRTELNDAAAEGLVSVTKRLLDNHGHLFRYELSEAYHTAMRNRHTDVASVLIAYKLPSWSNPPFYLQPAIEQQSDEGDAIFEQLIRAGMHSNYDDIVQRAVALCRSKVVKLLLETNDINVSIPVSTRATFVSFQTSLLHICLDSTKRDCLETAQILLSAGADVNYVNHRYGGGIAPMHLAVQEKSIQLVSLLISYGADVNVRSEFDTRPYGVVPNHPPITYRCPKLGYTPLEQAIIDGNTDVVNLLVNAGALVEPRWRWAVIHERGQEKAVAKRQEISVALHKHCQHRQEWQRLISLATLLAPFNLPVLTVYEIYCAQHSGAIVARHKAWAVLVAIKRDYFL